MKKSDFLEFAIYIAIQAGWNIQNSYKSFHERNPIWTSADQYKTAVDDMNDKLAREAIIARFPEHNIWSEEGDLRDQGSDYT